MRKTKPVDSLHTHTHRNRSFWLIPIFLLALFSCTSELLQTGYENSQNTSRNVVRQLRYSDFSKEAPSIVSKITKKGLVRSQTTEQSKTFTVNDFSIEADYVFISEHEDGKKTYTFWSQPNENSSWYLENYVLNEQDNGVLDAYIIRYDSLMATHQDQIMMDDIKNHMELEYQGQLSGNSTMQKALYCPKVPFQEYVWVPGVTCTSAEHHVYGESCQCDNSPKGCDRAEPGFYIIQMVLLPTDCGGGGASPGGGVGPGSSPISTGPYNPIGWGGGVSGLKTPCGKISELFLQLGFTEIYEEMTEPSVFNLNHEKVYAVKKTNTAEPQYVSADLPDCATEGAADIFNDPQVYAEIHDHQDQTCNPSDYPPGKFPSHIDIKTFINTLMPHALASTGSYANAYSLITTSEGNYMLMYSGTNNPGSINENQLKQLKKDYEKSLLNAYTKPNYDQKDVEAELLRFIKDKINKPGLEVYRVTSTTATKIEYNFPSPNKIKETPCN